ncbi:MAG: class I SAM-dependent methyltransferase [Actinobacteria bacterium]|nr:MAG: class I SAM-dependent methyltransferase [Actinomycetota bacterium]
MITRGNDTDLVGHWETVHERVGPRGGSWYQAEPRMSVALIEALGVAKDTPVIDVGGGSSRLVDELIQRGFSDISVLDVSARALQLSQSRLGAAASRVRWLREDLLEWEPPGAYGLWHDRALFHFLVEPEQRERYVSVLRASLSPGGLLIMATFAPDGPERCSGLPVARYRPQDLVDALGEGFTCLGSWREDHPTPGGATQPFTWVALRSPFVAQSCPSKD